ncbi:hypothetical protein QBA57_00785 [Streptomyces scabiei]|uniref:hypothetical protein n=1 Tax=Streptomyces scabiei TaxID=1930 RepID=UPI001F4824FD|nr:MULTISPECIES: hypothetical protein [Streptomyces]MDW8478162.1 hypothetical protein [Streptomyces scabiei]MDX2568265.1 hypothetical protein [Streptomyces scabiei]MDX2625669.1 hypothetical protein [Streptomyces scabiei]MDX2685261.1 hypothetical protein [Streptomyces scabiei]MDX2750256.1 hypothetical protein [Streptomyces scabiei]
MLCRPVLDVQGHGASGGRVEEPGELGGDGLLEAGRTVRACATPKSAAGSPPGPDMSWTSWSGPVLLSAAPASPPSRQKAVG